MPRNIRSATIKHDLTEIPMLEFVSKLERLTYFGDIQWDDLNQIFRRKHHEWQVGNSRKLELKFETHLV